MPIKKGKDCWGDVMGEFKRGQLSSGKNGPQVKSRQQAKAIAASICDNKEMQKQKEHLLALGYSERAIDEVLYGENQVLEMVMSRLDVIMGRVQEMKMVLESAKMTGGEVEIEPWMVDKITLAADYISAAADNAAYGDGVETESSYGEKKGLWANIHAKRERIKRGSGERMRKPGEKGAPSPEELKKSKEDFKEKKLPESYGKGLTAKEKKSAQRASKRSMDAPKKSDKALEMWPSDKKINKRRKESGKKAPESPATKAYRDKFGDDSVDNAEKKKSSSTAALKKKSEDSGIPLGILRSVYAKGVAAWKSGHRPGMTPQQWALARVNSFITGSGGARKADADLWKKAQKARKK